jgi:hypothetical protein
LLEKGACCEELKGKGEEVEDEEEADFDSTWEDASTLLAAVTTRYLDRKMIGR